MSNDLAKRLLREEEDLKALKRIIDRMPELFDGWLKILDEALTAELVKRFGEGQPEAWFTKDMLMEFDGKDNQTVLKTHAWRMLLSYGYTHRLKARTSSRTSWHSSCVYDKTLLFGAEVELHSFLRIITDFANARHPGVDDDTSELLTRFAESLKE